MIFDYVFVQKTKPFSQETEVQGSQVYLSVNSDSCLEKGFLETCAGHISLKVIFIFLFHFKKYHLYYKLLQKLSFFLISVSWLENICSKM